MRSLFTGITTRGRAFLAAGIVTGAFGLGLVALADYVRRAVAIGKGRHHQPEEVKRT